MPMKLHYSHYSIEKCTARPNEYFVFGDNLARYGKGGQAIIRDCPNAIGLATKHAPKWDEKAYLTDADAEIMAREFNDFNEKIMTQLNKGCTVWWPADGIGTGLADLPKKAPRIYQEICKWSRRKFNSENIKTISAIVCGGRDYNNEYHAFEQLDALFKNVLNDKNTILEIIEGNAKGADQIAGKWAKMHQSQGVIHTMIPANWNKYGKKAGFMRNSEMATRLQARRDQAGTSAHVIGFPGGRGTEMMLKTAAERGFDIIKVQTDSEHLPPPINKDENLSIQNPEQSQIQFDL